ncbi:MAG: Na+:solute symporter [Verrucomicrobia bacterium]|nr:Na+:solute symporter [Verrucomicrobiota bacterium]
MHAVDLVIIAVYLVLMALVGWWVAKKASRNAESYFLAGKSLPWWVIGVAHGSSGVDITGTMWFVMIFFIYGVKGIWLLWVWPLFSVIFRMMYLGTWVRRSNVLTGAEWMRTRFGDSPGAKLAYISVVVYALVHVVGFLSYAFRGIAEFTRPFFPWQYPDEVYGTAMLLFTGIYCVVGGMYSVVMNDLIQFVLKVIAAVGIAVIAIVLIKPEQLMAAVPAGWDQLFFGPGQLKLDWSQLMPQLMDRIYGATGDGYSLFMFFTGMLLLKGVAVSMAGPTPNYAIQHILSTRSPREAALENMVMAVVSLAPRFLLIGAIAVLGIVFFRPDLAAMGTKVNFEKILPHVLDKYVPIGFKGILIAALLASFMSTFVSTVNSGAAYVVNDIYKRYINSSAEPKRYVQLGWITSSAVIVLGIVFGFVMTKDVHSVTKWIVSSLIPAFVAPNVLKWHWWRFNGYGFFAGMVAGTLAALVIPGFLHLHEVFVFLLILTISTLASVVACLLTKPESDAVLKSFYRSVRPWGCWGPIYEKCRAENPAFQPNRDFPRDMFNVAVGLVWQTSLVTSPIYLVIQHWREMWISLAVCAVTSLILKFTWYDKLGPGEMYLAQDR